MASQGLAAHIDKVSRSFINEAIDRIHQGKERRASRLTGAATPSGRLFFEISFILIVLEVLGILFVRNMHHLT